MDEDDSDEDEKDEFEFEKFDYNQPKMSAQMILDLCHGIENTILFPLSDILCIVAPLKILFHQIYYCIYCIIIIF